MYKDIAHVQVHLVAQQVYWKQKENWFPCALENTYKVGAIYREPLLSYAGQWVDMLQESRKKMGFLNQFIPFSSRCLKGGRKRMKMSMELGVWCSFGTDSSSWPWFSWRMSAGFPRPWGWGWEGQSACHCRGGTAIRRWWWPTLRVDCEHKWVVNWKTLRCP